MKKQYLISLIDSEKYGFHHTISSNYLGLEKEFESLEDIDNFTKEQSEEDLIHKIIELNIYPDLNQENQYQLCIIYKDSKIRMLPMVFQKNRKILERSLESYFRNLSKEEQIKLYNHYAGYLHKTHIRNTFKNFICALKNEKKEQIIDKLKELNYEEKRELKFYINE